MNLIFPSKIEFVFIDHKTNKPVGNLVTLLTIFAKEKNDYRIGPKITSNQGKVIYTKEEVESAIKEAQRMFIMDYKSNLKECSQLVQIEILSEEDIKKFIQVRQEWGDVIKKLKLTNKEIKIFKQSSNKDYFPRYKKVDVMGEEIKGHNKIKVIPKEMDR